MCYFCRSILLLLECIVYGGDAKQDEQVRILVRNTKLKRERGGGASNVKSREYKRTHPERVSKRITPFPSSRLTSIRASIRFIFRFRRTAACRIIIIIIIIVMFVRALIRNVTNPASPPGTTADGERVKLRLHFAVETRVRALCIADYFFVRIAEFISGFGRGPWSEGN